MHRHRLLTLLRDHRTRFVDEAAMLSKTRRFVLENERCFDRDLAPGHVSGSAWIVNPRRSRVFCSITASSEYGCSPAVTPTAITTSWKWP